MDKRIRDALHPTNKTLRDGQRLYRIKPEPTSVPGVVIGVDLARAVRGSAGIDCTVEDTGSRVTISGETALILAAAFAAMEADGRIAATSKASAEALRIARGEAQRIGVNAAAMLRMAAEAVRVG